MESKEFYSPQEIANMLGVTRKTIYNWIVDNNINAVKIGRSWRISHQELQRFIEKGKNTQEK